MQTRVAGRPSSPPTGNNVSLATVMAVTGLAVAVLLGTWFTAQAVVAGDPTATFVRFAISMLGGWYYLYLYHLSRGRRFFTRS